MTDPRRQLLTPVQERIDGISLLASMLAAKVQKEGFLLTVHQQRNHLTSEVETHVNVSVANAVDDEGLAEEAPLGMEVTHNKEAGTVTMSFTRPIGFLDMTGDQAIEAAQALVNHAKLANFKNGHTFSL